MERTLLRGHNEFAVVSGIHEALFHQVRTIPISYLSHLSTFSPEEVGDFSPACSVLTCFLWAVVLEKVLSQELHCSDENLDER